MRVDTVITLENDTNCLLLEKAEIDNNNYFLAVVLNESEEPTEEYIIFKEIIENGEKYVEKVEDPNILGQCIKMFTTKLDAFVDSLPSEA